MNSNFRNFAIWIVIGLLLIGLFSLFQDPSRGGRAQDISYTYFLAEVQKGNIAEVTIAGQKLTARTNDGRTYQTYAPDDPELVKKLTDKGVNIIAKPAQDGSTTLMGVLLSWFPMLLLIAVWIFFMRQMQSGGRGAMGFGKSKARLLTERQGRVTFDDVAGVDEAKEELQEIVEFLRDPQKFQRLGGRIPRGALLVGPPGTGKTLIARAVAGEANVPFFTISGSDFVEMFVGVGASRVRDMFDQAKKNAPCIIFIDEIDAVGRHRGAGLGGGNDEREQTLNQLLVEMDGFEPNEGIIIMAATNRPDVLDPALLRPGRFDRQIVVPRPDIVGRKKILQVHVRKILLSPDVDLNVIARGTPGFSGADLANLVNEAALLAARRSKRMVTQLEFEDAKDKVMIGAERRSMVMTDEEKEMTAYHEGGHALVGLFVEGNAPLHKVTIIPRGMAGGVTHFLPEDDSHYRYRKKKQLEAEIAMAFGGRVAEELIYGEENVTTGASHDIQQATNLARAMVTEYGMSEKLGRIRYRDNQQEVFLGHSIAQTQNISEETANLIDEEVRRIIEKGEATARKVLSENIHHLHALAKALLEFETLSGQEVKDLINGKMPERGLGDDDEASGLGSAVPTVGVKTSRDDGAPDTGGMEPQPT